jgi:hypothetical protein
MSEMSIEEAFEDDSLTNLQIFDLFPQYTFDWIVRRRREYRKAKHLPPTPKGRRSRDVSGEGQLLRDYEDDSITLDVIATKYPGLSYDQHRRARAAHRESVGLPASRGKGRSSYVAQESRRSHIDNLFDVFTDEEQNEIWARWTEANESDAAMLQAGADLLADGWLPNEIVRAHKDWLRRQLVAELDTALARHVI